MTPQELWAFLLPGYLFSIAIETPVLLIGLSPRHSLGVRIFSGFWLTACTYPIVVLVLPLLIDANESRGLYLTVAEIFAPVAECALFWLAFGKPLDRSPRTASKLEPAVTERFEPGAQRSNAVASAIETSIAIAPTSAPEKPKGTPSAPATVSVVSMWRDLITITVANLASFLIGELVHYAWPGLFGNG